MSSTADAPAAVNQTSRRQWVVISALAGLLVLFWLAADAFLLMKDRGIDQLAPGHCDLHLGPCSAQRAGQRIRFSVASEDFSSHAPFDLRVELEQIAATRVVVDLQGRDMYMGLNRVELLRQPDGSYAAQTQLPVCTTGEMVWRAQVIVNPDQAPIGSWFDFQTH